MTPYARLVDFLLLAAGARSQGTAYWVEKYGTRPWPFYTKDPARAVRRLISGRDAYLIKSGIIARADYTPAQLAAAVRVVLTALALEDA